MGTALRCWGRRGAAIGIFSTVFLIYGIALFTADPARPGLGPILRFIPMPALGFTWITCAVGAMLTSTPNRSRIAFGLLMAMPLLWAASHLFSFGAWILTDRGYPQAWAGGLVWGLVAALLLLIAGWPDPPDLKCRDRGES